jgi:haloacid dehalogenase superfamily, subfamily IA, variant 3 with third motif having DD or ED
MKTRAFIFDVDGTLAETEESHRQAFNATFAAAGLDWHWDPPLYAELLKITGGKERIRAFLDRTVPAITMTDESVAALHRDKTKVYGDIIAGRGVTLRPGVRDLIQFARMRGIRTAVATTTNLPNVDALCIACWGKPAAAVFDAIAAGDEALQKKPAPDIYHIALERLGLGPDCCIAFEDSRNGLLAAKNAGLRVVVTPSQYSADEDFAEADLHLPDLASFKIACFG